MMVKVGGILVVASALTVVTASKAEATASLRLTPGMGPMVIVVDEGALDTLPGVVGAVGYNGPVSTWLVSVTTGSTKPVEGTVNAPSMTLVPVAISTGPATLKIEFTETDFFTVGPAVSLAAGLVGAPHNFVSYEAYLDDDNASFGDVGVFTSRIDGSHVGVPSGGVGSVAAAGFYSLTQVVLISHSSGGSTSVTAALIPEPALLSLFGVGLAGLGIAAKRRRANLQDDGLA
jgi:hypothetical protein